MSALIPAIIDFIISQRRKRGGGGGGAGGAGPDYARMARDYMAKGYLGRIDNEGKMDGDFGGGNSNANALINALQPSELPAVAPGVFKSRRK